METNEEIEAYIKGLKLSRSTAAANALKLKEIIVLFNDYLDSEICEMRDIDKAIEEFSCVLNNKRKRVNEA